jgi:hypothetical protein
VTTFRAATVLAAELALGAVVAAALMLWREHRRGWT